MTKRSRRISQPDELLRTWGSAPIPVEPEERDAERREVVIDAIAREIRKNSFRREKIASIRRYSAIALAAAMLLGIGGAWQMGMFAGAQAEQSDVLAVRGTVVLVSGQDKRVLSRTDDVSLSRGEEIQTAADGEAELHTRKAKLHLGRASKLAVAALSGREERLNLTLGHVEVAVDKDVDAERKVVVETPNAEVVVRGTVFSVDVRAPNVGTTVTNVKVTRGTVWVLVEGQRVAVLAAGQEWSSLAEPKQPVESSAHKPSADAELAPAPAAKEARSQTNRWAQRALEGTRKSSTQTKVAGTLAEENQLFQSALDARNRGDDVRAVELFERLLARFPRSTLNEEAQVERFRALKRLGKNEQAAASARRYLAGHKSGFARDEARNLALDGGSP